MPNPILSQMNRHQPINNNLRMLADLKSMVSSNNPQVLYDNLMRTNPQFSKFVADNKGKSVEQIAQQYGVDLDAIKQLIG